ncbi:MAG: acyl carrier protein [Candidatus Krumholzibacteria bacterium]|nr:acyl carrier protein [Candidatus Krumholzibacteria bacterium]
MESLLRKKEKIRQFIIETFLFDADDAALDDDESLLDLGIIDSTGVLEMVAFVEEEFGIEVKDEELVPENLDSISNLAAYIEKKV